MMTFPRTLVLFALGALFAIASITVHVDKPALAQFPQCGGASGTIGENCPIAANNFSNAKTVLVPMEGVAPSCGGGQGGRCDCPPGSVYVDGHGCMRPVRRHVL